MITQAELHKLYKYNPETGELTYASGPFLGMSVGELHQAGLSWYKRTRINGKRVYVHQIVWCYMTGEWPTSHIDHIDTNGFNNRWANLRKATKQQNAANIGKPRTNTSGYKGVSKRLNRYRAHIMVSGKSIALGTFDTAEEAHEAYVAAAREHFGEFARAS